MADVDQWSEIDGLNSGAPPDGAPEGQFPSTVNNVIRAIMGAVKRLYDSLLNGTLVLPYLKSTGGTVTGNATVTGTINTSVYQISGATFAWRDDLGFGTAHGIYSPTHRAIAMYSHSGGSPVTHYNNDTHSFDSAAGAIHATITASAATFNVQAVVPALTASGIVTANAGITSSFASSGSYQINGVVALARDANTTYLYDPDGNWTIGAQKLSIGAWTYYANTNHHFVNRGNTVSFADLSSAGLSVYNSISSTGQVSGASLFVSGGATTGGLSCGDISASGTIFATGTISTNSAIFAGGTLGATGNISTSGAISATGLISAGTMSCSALTVGFSGTFGSVISDGDIVINNGRSLVQMDVAGGLTRGRTRIGGETYDQDISNFYWRYVGATGQKSWVAGSEFWIMRIADNFCFNNLGSVGGNGAYLNFSDNRAKEDIAPTTRGMAEVRLLNPSEFRRKRPDARAPSGRGKELGFIAQDLRAVLPEAVTVAGFTLPDGTGGPDDDEPSLAVSTDAIVAVLVNAVKELDARLAAVERGRPPGPPGPP